LRGIGAAGDCKHMKNIEGKIMKTVAIDRQERERDDNQNQPQRSVAEAITAANLPNRVTVSWKIQHDMPSQAIGTIVTALTHATLQYMDGSETPTIIGYTRQPVRTGDTICAEAIVIEPTPALRLLLDRPLSAYYFVLDDDRAQVLICQPGAKPATDNPRGEAAWSITEEL
jgi:hypothetical protein